MELFNQNYINIVENSSGKKPSSLGDCLNASQDELTVKEIISVYSNHPSIQKIKSVFNTDSKFDLPKPTASDIKSFAPNKATSLLNLFKCHPMLLTVTYPISLPVTYLKINIPSMLK